MGRSLITITLIFLFFSCSNNSDDNAGVSENPSLKVTNKVVITVDQNNFLGVDDILTYTISVKNTGDVILNNINLTYSLLDSNGSTLSFDPPIAFVNSNADSTNGTLAIDETAFYTATYTITQSDVDAGGISNSITASGTTTNGEIISDLSDDGDDTDGNLVDDLTIINLTDLPIDSSIIAEYHILNSDGNPRTRLIFNVNGEIQRIVNTSDIPSSHGIFDVLFDSENRLFNVTKYDFDNNLIYSKNVDYDSSNRILSYGDRNFEFVDDDPDYYIDLETVNTEIYSIDNFDYVETNYIKYEKLEGNPIFKTCYYYYSSDLNTDTGEFSEYSTCSDFTNYGYSNGNVAGICHDTDCIDYSYNSIQNPLQSNTNLIDIFPIVNFLSFDFNPLLQLIVTNNITGIFYSDPSYITYTYTYNDNNLPATTNSQYRHPGEPDGDIIAFAKYYYQGDTIPD